MPKTYTGFAADLLGNTGTIGSISLPLRLSHPVVLTGRCLGQEQDGDLPLLNLTGGWP
jgi:hypothetical protein